MQITHSFDTQQSLAVGWGIRILLLSAEGEGGRCHTRLSGLGAMVEAETEFYAGLAALIDDPSGYALFVMDCDSLGGAEAGQRAMATLAAAGVRVPVILVSGEFADQQFPQDRTEATCLRAPLSSVSLRVGFEHALRDRLMWRAA